MQVLVVELRLVGVALLLLNEASQRSIESGVEGLTCLLLDVLSSMVDEGRTSCYLLSDLRRSDSVADFSRCLKMRVTEEREQRRRDRSVFVCSVCLSAG